MNRPYVPVGDASWCDGIGGSQHHSGAYAMCAVMCQGCDDTMRTVLYHCLHWNCNGSGSPVSNEQPFGQNDGKLDIHGLVTMKAPIFQNL